MEKTAELSEFLEQESWVLKENDAEGMKKKQEGERR